MTFLLTFDGVLEKYSYGISSIAASDASVRVAGQAQRDPPDERRALRGSPRFREQVAHPSRPLRPGIESICLLARPPPPRRARLIEQPQVLPPRSAAVRAATDLSVASVCLSPCSRCPAWDRLGHGCFVLALGCLAKAPLYTRLDRTFLSLSVFF